MVKQKRREEPRQYDKTIDIESRLRHSSLYVPVPTESDKNQTCYAKWNCHNYSGNLMWLLNLTGIWLS